MKRRRLFSHWRIQPTTISSCSICLCILATTVMLLATETNAGIVPPPWSDPEKNPCATMPGGWQLLYWAPHNKCYKIFTKGYPCPETMELTPTALSGKRKATAKLPLAQCRCPPGTAVIADTSRCYAIFERGPCAQGQYFKPISENGKSSSNHFAACKNATKCADGKLFWPQDGKCYEPYTKGPCYKGKLLVADAANGWGVCRCDANGELRKYYYEEEDSCHEHYTRGPCSTPGHLFLPDGRCDCQPELPHYDETQQMCYELDKRGPCAPGHIFTLPESNEINTNTTGMALEHASCQCKAGYVPWSDGSCYRLYSRGPCEPDEFIINATSCIKNFCGRSRLYFPEHEACFRIGAQGPCEMHQVVVFDYTARPSVDGMTYNGKCGCAGIVQNLDQSCLEEDDEDSKPVTATFSKCDALPGSVQIDDDCHKLYTQGPCGTGQWLEPIRTQSANNVRRASLKAKCVCRPGFTREAGSSDNVNSIDKQECNAPTVGLARYLNNQTRQNSKFNSNFPTAIL